MPVQTAPDGQQAGSWLESSAHTWPLAQQNPVYAEPFDAQLKVPVMQPSVWRLSKREGWSASARGRAVSAGKKGPALARTEGRLARRRMERRDILEVGRRDRRLMVNDGLGGGDRARVLTGEVI